MVFLMATDMRRGKEVGVKGEGQTYSYYFL